MKLQFFIQMHSVVDPRNVCETGVFKNKKSASKAEKLMLKNLKGSEWARL